MPMTSTATSGYDLASTGMKNAYDLANQQQKNQLAEFQNQLGLAQAQQAYDQLMGNKNFDAAQRQQEFLNRTGQAQQQFQNNLASQSANLYKDPAYLNYLQLTDPTTISASQQLHNQIQRDNAAKYLNSFSNGIIPANRLGEFYSTMMSAGVPVTSASVYHDPKKLINAINPNIPA